MNRLTCLAIGILIGAAAMWITLTMILKATIRFYT